MILKTKYMTKNDCYTAGRKIVPKGIMIHSTATPGVMAKDWFNRWNKSYKKGEINRQVCVHAFVDDKEVWQYLPWNHRGWHAGGKANDTHIGIEICEPGGFTYERGRVMKNYAPKKYANYFRKAWNNAVKLCVFLCQLYGLTEKNIICHSEGYKMGIASNHADVMHWFPRHGENMDTFRQAVKNALQKSTKNSATTKKAVFQSDDVVEIISSAKTYYPGGPTIPTWVKSNYYHKVTQTSSKGKNVIKGGKRCILLGKKVDKNTWKEFPGIMTWIDENLLKKIGEMTNKETKTKGKKIYKVQVGAFLNKENAELLTKKLKKAGFEGYITEK